MMATPGRVKWCVLAPMALVAACRPDANVVIQLVNLPSEDPYSGVAALEISTSVGEQILAVRQVELDGQPTELPPLDPRDDMIVRVSGLAADATVISRGLAQPEIPDGDEACCVLMCFCTTPVFEAGDCSCGSDACVAECFQ